MSAFHRAWGVWEGAGSSIPTVAIHVAHLQVGPDKSHWSGSPSLRGGCSSNPCARLLGDHGILSLSHG